QHAFLAVHRYKDACYPVVPLLRQLHAQGQLTEPSLAQVAQRLPEEELYDLETDPDEVKNLVDTTDADLQRALQTLRGELNRWLEMTNDQGRTPEPAELVRQWDEHMEKRFGALARSRQRK